MKKSHSLLLSSVTVLVLSLNASGQTSFTSTSATTAWNANRWNNSTDVAPYTSAFTANNAVSFTSGTYTFAGMGAATNVGNVTVASGVSVTFASIGSTYATGGAVRTIDVGTGGLFDLNGNAFSTAAGTGLIKTGAGVFGTGAGTFTGGFTLNQGTVIARGSTGLGSGASNTLALNGGTIASNANRDFASTRFGGGISIGGNVQFGELSTVVSLASNTANLSFANNVSLGSANRTLTQGNNGANTFSGIIANTGSGGISFAANANTDGRFDITNSSNTFTGDITITGGEARFTVDGSMGNAANDIIIDGGRFSKASEANTVTLGAGRNISVGDGTGTSISSPGSGTLIYNNAIANKTGETGSWAKQGGGTLELGGVSTYTGNTAINNGTLRLTTGNDRLPTGTVVSMGQSASTNLGTLDLNGRSQTIAGLVSTAGINVGSNTNIVTSDTAATLTINVASNTTHTYSAGTAANSGVISGALSIEKTGSGTQVLNGSNTYSGTTTVTQGKLVINGSVTSTSVVVNGSLGGNGVMSSATLSGSGTIDPGNSPGVMTASAANPSSGLDFNFEFTQPLVVPDWDVPTNSINDVLRLTSAAPFTQALNSSNLISVYLNIPSIAENDVFTGGFYTDNNASFLNQITSASYQFLLANNSGSVAYNGQNYSVYSGPLNFTVDTVAQSANFGAGAVSGYSMRITAVPEPSSLALVGLSALAMLRRRRRN